MKKKNKSEIRLMLNEFLRSEIVNEHCFDPKQHKSFLEYVKKYFKFSEKSDWMLLCSSMDNISDMEAAIQWFKLSKGISLLMVLGFLTAIYQQVWALKALGRLWGSELKEEERKLDNLKLMEIRNKIAGHITNYKNNEKKESFFLNPRDFKEHTVVFYRHGDFAKQECDLDKALLEYDRVSVQYFTKVLEKCIKITHKAMSHKKKDCLLSKLEEISRGEDPNSSNDSQLPAVTIKIVISDD